MSGNSSSQSLLYGCVHVKVALDISIAMMVVKSAITLPLSAYIFYLGHQQWRRSSATTSHFDVFIYHMTAMELIWVFGCVFYLCGIHAKLPLPLFVGTCICLISFYGQTLSHTLTCVDRYLAVVHPVTYLGLRNARGVRIRDASLGCVWLLSFGLMGFLPLQLSSDFFNLPLICLTVVSFVVISFCSLSTLCVLIRPGPGEAGGDQERVDQTKKRAFYTITAIMASLWLWLLGLVTCIVLSHSALLSASVSCVMVAASGWLYLPCSLVLPVLYLHKARKLPCCSYNSE